MSRSGSRTLAATATKAQHGDDYARLPPFLRARREAAGLTQRGRGASLGKPQSWVYNYETANRRVDVTGFAAWAACAADPAAALAWFLAGAQSILDAGPE